MQKFKVSGPSGQTAEIEAVSAIDAAKQFVEHYGEPATKTLTIIHEKDTADA